ncbi:MAG: SDR family oxidoreductase [Bacteroidota bacterium]
MNMKGKVVVVTGATSGIGQVLCEEVARRGATAIVTGRNLEKAEQIAENIRQAGHLAEALKIDVSRKEEIQLGLQTIQKKHSQIDYLFNNAAILYMGEYFEMTEEKLDQLIDINLKGVAFGMYYAYPIMKEQGHGHIVNIASQAGLMPVPSMAAYSSSKHGVVGLSNSVRVEAEPYNVRVSVACLGLIKSEMLQKGELNGIDKGTALKWMRFKEMDTLDCVRQILKNTEKNKAYIVVPGYTRLLWWISRTFPRGVIKLVRRSMEEYRSMRVG